MIPGIISYKKFTTERSLEELAALLTIKHAKLTITRKNLTSYSAEAQTSFGIFTTMDLFYLPIKTNLLLRPLSGNTIIAELKTSLRPELILLTLVWMILVVLKLFSIDIPIAVPVLFPLVILWFWWIYKAQEEELHSNIEALIKSV